MGREIEAFPIAVTRLRFPNMLHVGDITKLNGAGPRKSIFQDITQVIVIKQTIEHDF